MRARTRRLAPALGVGAVAAIAAIVGVLWLGGAFDSGPATDGSFELVEPGVFSEPTTAPLTDLTGDRLPTIDLVDAEAAVVRLHEHRGTPMVLNLWYSTCPPCARELADFAEVHREVGDRVRFVGIDPRDTPEEMIAFAEARGVEYELLLDDGGWVTEMNVIAYPTTLFVDANGLVVRQEGVLTDGELRDDLAELFGVEG